jgi:hypothetical protein
MASLADRPALAPMQFSPQRPIPTFNGVKRLRISIPTCICHDLTAIRRSKGVLRIQWEKEKIKLISIFLTEASHPSSLFDPTATIASIPADDDQHEVVRNPALFDMCLQPRPSLLRS